MLKRLISICLCTFMLCTMIFVPSVGATGTTPFEVTEASFTDDLTTLDNMYSYPNATDNWHLELETPEINGNPVTAVRYKCGDNVSTGAIPDSSVIWYKAGAANGFDRKFSKAEFIVWINATKYDGGKRTPVVKVKDSANGAVTTLLGTDVTWTTVTNGTAATSWYCQVKGTATIPLGAEFVGLGFNNSDISVSTQTIFDNAFYLDKVVLTTGAEAAKYYNDGSTLDDAWSYTNMQVVSDNDNTNGNYNNGGHMIQPIAAYNNNEVVYKVPEGRSFKSFFTEISMQTISDAKNYPNIEYSEDGTSYTDFNIDWGSSLGAPGSGQCNAGWAHKYAAAVTAPENTNIKFIKLSQSGAELNSVVKFMIRKVSMITEGSTVSGNVTDSMSGAEKINYEISNLMPYALWCYKNSKKEAEEIEKETDKFSDSDLLAVSDTTKDAYITYKAADGKVFTSVQADQLIRNKDIKIKIYASTDGVYYVEITPNNTSNGYIGSDKTIDAYWNAHWVSKADFDRIKGYKYIKLMHSEGTLETINNKLASVALTTATAPENTVVSPGFKETFESTDNLCDFYGIAASAAESRFRPTDDAVAAGKTEPVYAMYKIADGKRFGYVKAKFTQTDINSKDNVAVYALDANKEVIEWDNSELWSVYSHQAGANTANEYIFKGEVPSNAKYLKLQMSYLADDWRCVINGFEVYGPYDGSIYSVDGEGAETDLNGVLTNGNIKGTVTFGNVDATEKDVYAIAAVKEGDQLVKATVKPHTITKTGEITLDTKVLEDCTFGDNTTLEIYVIDITDGELTPVLPEKIVY